MGLWRSKKDGGKHNVATLHQYLFNKIRAKEGSAIISSLFNKIRIFSEIDGIAGLQPNGCK